MRPFREFDGASGIAYVLCDLDDTLTLDGQLPAASYSGLEKLQASGRKLIVVTGRPAGWCDLIARLWPVDGVVGENGAFYFRYRRDAHLMVRKYLYDDAARAQHRKRLLAFFARLKRVYPHLQLASDQAFRVSDIAIDICEDVEPLAKTEVADIVARLETMGATVKVSSIHINAWIGDFDKLSMIREFLRLEFKLDDAAAKTRGLYVGDSPNDEPMFANFPHSVGVRNVEAFAAEMTSLPRYITRAPGGLGFLEVARLLTGESGFSRERSRRSSSPARR
jgi:HAD superfamily hydrolase (TIGR01484 family)